MQSATPSTAVGIDLGSATTTVMVRRAGRSAANLVDPMPDELRAPGTFSAALVVTASWDDERRAEHVEAAARVGFDRVALVPEPEAAARYYSRIAERELEPGTPLIVYSLGAESCNVGIVSTDGDEYEVHAAADADGIGGARFDELLLDHLADRYRSSSPAFWLRIEAFGPNSERDALLDRVRAARERLTGAPAATIDVPERELTVTRDELEALIADTVARTADLAEQTLDVAGVGPARRAELMLIGGASRTPLVARTLERRLGIEPFVPELPDLVAAEGAALAAADAPAQLTLGAGPVGRPKRRPRPRSRRPVLALVLVLAAVLAAAGVMIAERLLSDPPVVADGPDGEITLGWDDPFSPAPPTTDGAEPTDSPESAEASEGDSAEEAPAPAPTPDPGPGDEDGTESAPGAPAESATAPATEEGESEEPTGTVPDVTGRTLAEAERLLAEAGFTDIERDDHRRTSQPYDDCEVTQQAPQGGEEHPLDERIALTYVYVGQDTC